MVWCLKKGFGRRFPQHLGGFFSPNVTAPVYRKKGFYTSCLPKNEEIGEIFVLKSKEF
jgi:hypothetical protein